MTRRRLWRPLEAGLGEPDRQPAERVGDGAEALGVDACGHRVDREVTAQQVLPCQLIAGLLQQRQLADRGSSRRGPLLPLEQLTARVTPATASSSAGRAWMSVMQVRQGLRALHCASCPQPGRRQPQVRRLGSVGPWSGSARKQQLLPHLQRRALEVVERTQLLDDLPGVVVGGDPACDGP